MKTKHKFVYKYIKDDGSFYYLVNITHKYKKYTFYFPSNQLKDAIAKRNSFLKEIGKDGFTKNMLKRTPNKNKKLVLPAGISFFTLTEKGKKSQYFEITAGRLNGKHLQKRIKICKDRTYDIGLKQAKKIRAEFVKLKSEKKAR